MVLCVLTNLQKSFCLFRIFKYIKILNFNIYQLFM